MNDGDLGLAKALLTYVFLHTVTEDVGNSKILNATVSYNWMNPTSGEVMMLVVMLTGSLNPH